MFNKEHRGKLQNLLPYKNIDDIIKQIESDDVQIRREALKNIKNYGELASYKLIEKIKNNPAKIDSYIVIALDDLGKKAYTPLIQSLSAVKSVKSLKDLIFLETLIDVAKDIFLQKDKELLYRLLSIIEKSSLKRTRNKVFQSFYRNLKIKIFECLFKFNDRTVYRYVLGELQRNAILLTDVIVDVLKKFGDAEVIGPLLEIYKLDSGVSESNIRLMKNIIKSIYKKSNVDLATFAAIAKINNPSDLALLNSILR